MPENFFVRLREYYLKVGAVLRGEADSASIFPNPTDIGQSREKIYAEFLRLHAPSKCNVFLGGFLFDHENGNESKQLDIIITTDTTPRYNLHNRDGSGKSFSPVEGTLGVVSVKSTLNKAELEDALSGIASIPPTSSLEGRVSFTVEIMNYEDWPYKVIFATDGINGETLLSHLTTFYNDHPEIPIHRRPNLIHVAGKYVVMRVLQGMNIKKTSGKIEKGEPGTYRLFTKDPDLQGIVWVLTQLQDFAAASTEIAYSYRSLVNKVNLMP
jgi:hypothetical protein